MTQQPLEVLQTPRPACLRCINLGIIGIAVVATCLLVSRAELDSHPGLADTISEQAPSIEALPGQPAKLSATAGDLQTLSAYIAKRWSVADHFADRVVRLAYQSAVSNKLDPLLVLSVVAKESAFQFTGNAGNMKSVVPVSAIDPEWAHGLMQVAGRFHVDKMPVDRSGNMRVTTDAENMQIGTRILREYLDLESGNIARALQRYNGNLKPGDTRFSSYVLRMREKFAELIAAT